MLGSPTTSKWNERKKMQFMVEYQITSENRDVVQAQFKETGGMPPEGAAMTGRWHMAAGSRGYILCETDDPVALGKWFQDWTHLMTFQAHLVVGDEEIAEVIS